MFDLAIQTRDLAQKSGLVVAQRILDLIGDRQARGAQHAGLPQLGHACAQQRLVVAELTCGAETIARSDQLRHGVLGIENTLALHLGRVRGQHRRDMRAVQDAHDVSGTHIGLGQTLEAEGQRTFLQMTFAFVMLAAAYVVAIFGDVGEMGEVAEGTDHADGLVGA